MKRTSPLRSQGISSSDPFKNCTNEQLTYIGAVALLYNELEERIDEMCAAGLCIPINGRVVTSRINGMDGKLAILKDCARAWGFSDDGLRALEETLGANGFGKLKSWRDGVIHARMFDISSAVARTPARRGGIAEVLLSQTALEGLYSRLDVMRLEFWHLSDFLDRLIRIKRGGITDQHKARLEAENRESWSQFQSHQSRRLSLPPMPEFPEDRLDFGRFRDAARNQAATE